MRAKTKLILTSFLLLFFFLILISFLVFLLRKIEGVSNKILEIKREDLSFSQRIQNINEFEKIKEEKKEEFSKLENILFNKDLPLPFVTFLEEKAREKGVSIEISTKENLKKEKEIFPSIYFKINFQGPFSSIFSFLEKIEKSQFLVQFENLRISRAKEGENLEGEVLVKVFVKE